MLRSILSREVASYGERIYGRFGDDARGVWDVTLTTSFAIV